MIQGFVLRLRSNKSDMCSRGERVFDDVADLPRCTACGFRTDLEYTHPRFALRDRRLDLGRTVDGAFIASARVRSFCREHGYHDVEFRPLAHAPGFFHVVPQRLVRLDLTATAARFDRFCPRCGLHREVTASAAGELHIAAGMVVGEGIFRSDVLFGEGNALAPLLVIGGRTREKLIAARLRGIGYEALIGRSPVRERGRES